MRALAELAALHHPDELQEVASGAGAAPISFDQFNSPPALFLDGIGHHAPMCSEVS